MRITGVTDLQNRFQEIADCALSILEQSIQAVIKCSEILASESSNVRDFRGFIEHLMAVHLRVIAGVCYGRSTFDYKVVEDPLMRIYELKPWQHNLFVREAIYEVIVNTTLHPPSFEALLELTVQCKEEIRLSKERGAIAFPQGEKLLVRCKELAWNYLHFSSEGEVGDRGFCDILDRWMQHEDAEIRELAAIIKIDFCSH